MRCIRKYGMLPLEATVTLQGPQEKPQQILINNQKIFAHKKSIYSKKSKN